MDEVVAQLKKDPGSVKWGGVYGAPGITAEQRRVLTEMVAKALKSKAWADAVETHAWTPAELTGKAFDEFVEREFAELRDTLTRVGLVQG